MTKQDAIEYVQSCGADDGPDSYEEAVELFTALYGCATDAQLGDSQGEIWSPCCAWVPE